MIRYLLLPVLETDFPNRGLRAGEPPDPIAAFPAAHTEVGDVNIYDDGNEAMVSVGQITHVISAGKTRTGRSGSGPWVTF